MAQIAATYRLRVHERGVTEPSDATVDFTLGASALADLPTIPGPVARPLDGRTETQAWTLGVVDTGDVLTSRLADGGRMHLLGRLAEYQESRDGGSTWETLYTGRIAGVTETSLGRYDVRIADERWHERQARIFTATDTTSIWPIGTLHEWRLGATLLNRWYWPVFDAAGVDPFGRVAVRIQRIPEHCPLGGRITQAAIDLIRSDRIERDSPDLTTANYKTLRLHIETPDGAEAGDAEVIGFDTDFRTYLGLTTASPAASLDESLEAGELPERVWVRWPDGMTPPGPLNRSFVGYLYAPDHEPTHALPLHLGVYESGHPWGGASSSGVHPFEIVRRIYDAAGVRYDPDAFDALAQDPTYYSGTWRITEPARVAEWVERHIYQPTLVLPFIDNQGRVSPKSLIPPANLDPDDLFVFDASNTKPPYPTFDHQDGEVANVVVPTLDADVVVRSDDPADHDALDGWTTESRELDPIWHDTVEADPPLAPEKPVRIDVSGWQMWDILRAQVYARFAAHVLQRFGDGPVAHVLYGTEATREVQAGDFVIIDQDSLRGPNPATNARSGKRLVQILKRDILPIGYRYEILDLGPALQPLSAPSVSVAQDSGNQKHSILVTLSNVPEGATATVEIARDSDFEDVVQVVTGLGNGTHAIGPLASGTQFYVRAESVAPGRIRSASSATQTVTTQALSAPTNADATASGRTIRLDWTPTEPGYAIVPTLDGDDALPSPLPPGSDSYVFSGLDASTQYTVGVKHVDPYGGESSIASDAATTGTSTQLASPRRLWIRQGRSSPAEPGADVLSSLAALMQVGLEVQFHAAEPSASHRAQVSLASDFSAVLFDRVVAPGLDRVRLLTPMISGLLYVRIRAEREGYTDSDWSETVSAYPTPLLPEAPETDAFPGGFASLAVASTGAVSLTVGSADPDTDRAYWAVATNGFPTVTEASAHVERSEFPKLVATGITLTFGQTAYATVRFWSARSGFGQAVYVTQAAPPEVAGGANLLVATAWDESPVTVNANATRYPGRPPGTSAANAIYPLSSIGAVAGGKLSFSALARATQAGAVARIGMVFVDSNGDPITPNPIQDTTSTTFTRLKVEGATIPANAVGVRPFYGERGGTGQAEFDLPMWNHGPICLEPVPPMVKPSIDTADTIKPGDSHAFVEPTYVDEQGRPIKLRRTGGDVTAEQFVAENESITRLTGRTLDNISDTASFRRVSADYVDASNRPIALRRTSGDITADQIGSGVDRAVTGLTIDGRLQTGVEPTADIDGRPASELRGQVEAPSQNLLVSTAWEGIVTVNANATRYPGLPGASAAVATYPLSVLGVSPGDKLSFSAQARAQSGGRARIGLVFVDENGDTISPSAVQDTTSTTFARLKVEGATIPANAVGIRPFFGERNGVGQAEFELPMLNRGPICLEPEAPPGRPGRERIDVWDGTLRPTVTASDGAAARLLPKGVLHGSCWNGNAIVYEQPYQNTPIPVIFQGPTMDERSTAWYDTINDALTSPNPGSARTPGGRVKQVWSAIASPAGFEPRLVLVNLGGSPVAKSISFPSSPLTEGQASAPVTPASADTPSIGDRYTASYSAVVIRGVETGDVQAYVTVVVEVSLNGGAYAEMGTDMLTITIPDGLSTGSGSGSFQFVATIGGGNDNVRIRFKRLEFSMPGQFGIGNVTPGSLSWSAATAQYANATPDGEVDALPFVIIPQG